MPFCILNLLKTRACGIVSENGRGDDSNHVVTETRVESRVPETTVIQEEKVKPPVQLDKKKNREVGRFLFLMFLFGVYKT